MTERFIADMFNAYQQLRAIYLHFTFTQAIGDSFNRSIESETLATLEGSMSELRLLITALSSITGIVYCIKYSKTIFLQFFSIILSSFVMLYSVILFYFVL